MGKRVLFAYFVLLVFSVGCTEDRDQGFEIGNKRGEAKLDRIEASFQVKSGSEPGFVVEGPGSSGGGGAIITVGPNQEVTSAKLIDLEEVIQAGGGIQNDDRPYLIQLAEISNRIKTLNIAIGKKFDLSLAKIQEATEFIQNGRLLGPVTDLGGPIEIPVGSDLRYVAFYSMDGKVRVSSSAFNLFSETEKAALFVHEAIYLMARFFNGATNSKLTRVFVGQLFSASPPENLLISLKKAVLPNEKEEIRGSIWAPKSCQNLSFETDGGGYTCEFTCIDEFDEPAKWVRARVPANSIGGLFDLGNIHECQNLRNFCDPIDSTSSTYVSPNTKIKCDGKIIKTYEPLPGDFFGFFFEN